MTDRASTFRIAVRAYDAFERAIAASWSEFCRNTGCTLTLEAVPMDLHPLHAATFEQGGLKDGTWDVAFVCTDWIGEAEAGNVLKDLGPNLRSTPPEGYPGAWPASLLRHQTFTGAPDRVYGLPYHDGPECLIVRKDLFADPAEQAAYQRQYGSPLRVPETWDEYHRVARFFTRPEKNRWGTIFAAFPDGHNTVYDFCLQVWTRGGEVFDQSGRMQLDSPAAKAGLEFYRTILRDQTAIHPESPKADSVKSGLAFARGEVAMMVNWFGFAALGDADPNGPTAGKASVHPIPHAPGQASASLSVYWLLGIGSGSTHADIAWQFLRHCAAPAADKRLTMEGAIGCRYSTWNDTEVRARTPYYAQLDTLHACARELPRHPRFAELATVIDGLVLAVMTTDTPVAELCATFQAKADSLVASHAKGNH